MNLTQYRHKTRIKCLALFASLLLLGCNPPAEEHHHTNLNFGTLIDISLYDVPAEQAEKAFLKLDEDFTYLHIAWSPFEVGSLRRTNGLLKTGSAFSAGPSILPMIERSRILAQQTNQLFNPAIGKLINLWAFHKYEQPGITPPDVAAIEQLLQQNPTLDDLEIKGIKLRGLNPAVELNFGAFAKGYAIDMEMQELKRMGIKHAIINTGGDLKAIGRHGDRPWKIAVRHPRQDTWLAQLSIQGEESVFTSGDYERYYMYQGKRYHHILDPRTGYPAQGTQSVTVVHHDSGLADAAATALFIAGESQWLEIARNLGITQAMRVDDKGVIHVTPQLHKRLFFNPQIQTTIIETSPL